MTTPGSTCSNAELLDQSLRLTHSLRQLGVAAGARIGILVPNRAEWLVVAHASLAAGATLTAFNTWSKSWDLDHMLQHSECEVLVVLDRFDSRDLLALVRELVPEAWSGPGWSTDRYPHLRQLVTLGSARVAGAQRLEDLISAGDPERGRQIAQEPRPRPGELIFYTSGSTAAPKAVRITQDAALRHAREVATRMGLTSGETIYVPVPLFWSYGGANALMVALVTASEIVTHEAFDAEQGLRLIEEHRCTAAYLLPNITSALLTTPAFAPERVTSLERGMTIGPPASVLDAANALGVHDITNAYGSTEMYGGAVITPWDWPLEKRATSQGLPLPGNIVRLVDPVSGDEVADGEVGEIVVKGWVSPGYLKADTSGTSPFDPDGTFRTGDLARIDGKGLHFVGRAAEMIRSGGINVSPLEVEQFFLTHDAVADIAVVGVEAPYGDEQIVAFIRLAPGFTLEAADLLAYARERIASYKIPKHIVLRNDDFPRTSTGKLARSELKALAVETSAESLR